MSKIKVFVFAAVLFCFAGLVSFTRVDDDILKKIVDQLGKWSAENPPEKVYLHLDKPYYAIGDDIWFKAYVTIGSQHRLSALSGILNVELIDEKDSIKKALKLPLTSGISWGDFKLSDSLREGNYRIRAYTNYMRNAGEDYFFDQTILVGNAINNTVFTKTDYTFTNVNNQQKVNATINYADLDGKPYAGKELNYEVKLNFRNVARGKTVTDDKGNAIISFTNPNPTLFKSGIITTNLKLAPKQVVTKVLPLKATSGKVDLQFFPESGPLVNGIRSRVAFKATGSDGLGADVKGIVTDNQNNEIAAINTAHLGMGYFTLTPEAGKTYRAKITYPDGSESMADLPKADDRGFGLSVYNNDPENLVVKVTVSPVTFQENQNAEISLVGQSNGKIYYAAKNKLEGAVFSAKIPKSRFPSGIAQFTLFSAKGEPMNERITFIQNADLLNLTLSTGQQSSKPRDKMKLDLLAKNKDGQPVVGSFSVSVIDEGKVNADESAESTILSNILLTSDIKGYVEKPNYYFTKTNDKTRTDLDLLMMTQGYRRFVWKQLMADNFPALAFQPEKSIEISGHLKTPGGKLIPHGKVTLLSTSGGTFLLDTVTDDQGKFSFKNLIFADSVKFVIQARNQKDRRNVEIELDNVPPQIVTLNKNSADVEVNVNKSMAYYLQNSKKQYDDLVKYGIISKSILLKGVTVTDKKQDFKNSTNLNGAGFADQTIKAEQLNSCPTLSVCLQGRLVGVIFRNGIPYSTRSLNTPMGIVVDGIYLEGTSLDDLVPTDIETIEVLRSIAYTAIYGYQGSGGLLVITTKRGDSGSSYKRYAPGIITYSPQGYYRARVFYSPQYDNPKTNTQVADLRSTIFWKPDIITDKNGAATMSYFNADGKGTYRAVVEGIDAEGNIGRGVYRYKIE